MNDTFLVRRFEGFGDLEGKFEGFLYGDGTARQLVGQRVTVHQFKDQESSAVVFLEAVDGRYVRVIQRSEQFGFTLKPYQAFFVSGELFREGLDGDLASELGVPCTPHLAHPALAEGRNDFVVCEFGAGLNHSVHITTVAG